MVLVIRECEALGGAKMAPLKSTLKQMRACAFPLRQHQLEGLKWMLASEKSTKKGGILADDPGLGKTIQALALCYANRRAKTLISVPAAVILQWQAASETIFGKGEIYIHYGSGKLKSEKAIRERDFSICITSHGMLYSRNTLDITNQLHIDDFWDRLIIDEGHVIRNRTNKISQGARRFDTKYRWLLTGTPIQNSAKDMINLLEFIGVSRACAQYDLQYYVKEYVLRRQKNIIYDADFREYAIKYGDVAFKTKREQQDYMYIQGLMDLEIQGEESDGIDAATDSGFSSNKLEWMTRMRQASSDPWTTRAKIDGREPVHAKYTPSKIRQVVEDLTEASGLSIIFCHFRHEMNMVKEHILATTGRLSYLYNGDLNITERHGVLNRFSERALMVHATTNLPVLIIQIKAGGVGINLQQFENVFILSPDWNPTNEIQAISRAHRMGQKKKVLVTKYIMIINPELLEESERVKEPIRASDVEPGAEVKLSADAVSQGLVTMDQYIQDTQKTKCEIMVDILRDPTLSFRK
tara:strand:+ start:354 stop:1928 length:1575 start_codon:yes stop_codon:yes gene_type:complete